MSPLTMDFGDTGVHDSDEEDSDVLSWVSRINNGLPLVHQAAADDDCDALVSIVTQDPSVLECLNPDGLTPLGQAVKFAHISSVKTLVKMGANKNAQDHLGRTCLSVAAYQGWYDGVMYLLRHGANQHIRDGTGRTPLHAATYHTDTSIMNALLKTLSEEDINLPDDEGMTALHWSCFHDRPLHVKILLQKDANIWEQDIDGKTPLHWAAQNGCIQCCDLISKLEIASSLVNMIDHSGKTAIHFAAAAGHRMVLEILVSIINSDVQALDPCERTPLHWAAAMGHAECVSFILQLGVISPDFMDSNGATSLDYAQQTNNAECIAMLTEAMRQAPDYMSAFSKISSQSTTSDMDTPPDGTKKQSGFQFFKGLLQSMTSSGNNLKKNLDVGMCPGYCEVSSSDVDRRDLKDSVNTFDRHMPCVLQRHVTDEVTKFTVGCDGDSVSLSSIKASADAESLPDVGSRALCRSSSDTESDCSLTTCVVPVPSPASSDGDNENNNESPFFDDNDQIESDNTGIQSIVFRDSSSPTSIHARSSQPGLCRTTSLQPVTMLLAQSTKTLVLPNTTELTGTSPRSVRYESELAPLKGPKPPIATLVPESVSNLRKESTGYNRPPTPPSWRESVLNPMSPRTARGSSSLAMPELPPPAVRRKKVPSSSKELLQYCINSNQVLNPSLSPRSSGSMSKTRSSQPASNVTDPDRKTILKKSQKVNNDAKRERKELDKKIHNLLL